jgi:hypothetical protein
MVFQRFDVPALLDNVRRQPLYCHIVLSAPWRDLIVNLSKRCRWNGGFTLSIVLLEFVSGTM